MATIRTNGVETYYERRGDGPTVVFVHASMLDHSVWDEQVDALSGDYETIAYDLRGHGRTGRSAATEYTIDLYVEDLRALLSELGVRDPVLCGLSMGGTVALTYAATYPDDVAGPVLVDAFAPEFRSRGEWFLRGVVLRALVPPVRLLGLERVERANVWLTARFFSGADARPLRRERTPVRETPRGAVRRARPERRRRRGPGRRPRLEPRCPRVRHRRDSRVPRRTRERVRAGERL